MDESIKSSLLAWLSGILQTPVTMTDIQTGNALVQLANLTGDTQLVYPDLTSNPSIECFNNYLDSAFQFRASSLFDVPAIVQGSSSEEEIFGVCLLVLLSGLQSKLSQYFMDAALDLDLSVQSLIFHLVREPMTQLSADQPLTRDTVLAGFREPVPPMQSQLPQEEVGVITVTTHPSTLTIPDVVNSETTPIRSASIGKGLRQSWCGFSEVENNEDRIGDLRKSWSTGLHAPASEVVSCSPAQNTATKSDVPASSPTFRAPEPVRRKKKKTPVIDTAHERTDPMNPTSLVPDNSNPYSAGPSDDDLSTEYQSSNLILPLSPSTLPPPPPPSASGDVLITSSNVRHQRPSELRLVLNTQSSAYHYQSSRPTSQSNSLMDLSDVTTGQKSHLHPPASPLASLKHLLDSPLWTHKTRLREAEREKRRLMAELDKERTYRDEVESVVAELRTQLDEARRRATEAESRATRLSRELSALLDQADELNLCRTELAVREDEIANLKKRLNSYQDLMAHSRKLELENANLQQECADHKQKVEQLSSKLCEIKDRRMVCTEVETLRSKLRDVEAQLAQQLLERETAEKDARRQQELYSQLKLQQTVLEKRRARNARRPSAGVDPKHLSSQMRLNALHSGDEIECEDAVLARAGSKDSIASTNSTSSKLKSDTVSLRDGENLGSVLESELRVAQTESSRLKNKLEEVLTRLHKREQDVNQLSERVEQLTIDLASSSTQCELSDQAADQTRGALTQLQTDLATLEGRLIWARTMNQKDLDELRQSADADVVAQLESLGIIERVKGIGAGLPEPLDQLCQLFTANLDDVWGLIIGQFSSLQTAFNELRSSVDYTKNALIQKENELAKVTKQLHEQTKHHAQQLAAEQIKITDLKTHLATLEEQHNSGNQTVSNLEKQIEVLLHEKQQLTIDLDQLKEQSSREMGQSKDILDHATQRLHELEKQLELRQKQEEHADVATQTDKTLGELPVPTDESPLSESLYRSDVEESEQQVEGDGPPVVEQPESAYEALAADRRGLSDELVRLHDELADSHLDRCELKQQVIELQDELITKEMDLQRQTALYSRAQEQWVLAEREALDAKNQLAQLRSNYTSQLENLRAELLPQISRSRSEASATASQIEAVRLKYEAEREDLKNKLLKATNDLKRLEVDRSRLIELNTSLQRELTTTRRLAETVAHSHSDQMSRSSSFRDRQQVAKALEVALRSHHTPTTGPLEEWLESVTANNANHHSTSHDHNRRDLGAYDVERMSDSLSGASSHPYELEEEERLSAPDSQLASYGQRTARRHNDLVQHSSRSGLHTRLPKQTHRRVQRRTPRRHSDEIARQVERLTSQTAALETIALNLQQNVSERLQHASVPIASSTLCTLPYGHNQQPYVIPEHDSYKPHSVSLGGPITNGLDPTNTGLENPASAPVQYPQNQHPMTPHNHHQHPDLDTDADSSAFTDLSQVSSASRHGHSNTDHASSSSPHQHSSPYSLDLSQMSVPHRSDSAYSSRQTRTTQPPQSLSLLTGTSQGRGQRHNGKPELTKASPIETDPDRIAELNRRNRLQPMHLRTSYPVETQTVNPEKVANALRQLSSKMRSKEEPNGFRRPNGSATLTTVPEVYGNVLRENDDKNVLQPSLPLGLTNGKPVDCAPKSGSQSERSEETTGSMKEKAAGYRPIPRNLNSITEALIAASDDPSAMAAALEAQLARAALVGSKSESARSSRDTDTKRTPPTLTIQSARGSVHSDKQNSSIAFEILMEPTSGKPRRLPARRPPSSTIVRRLPGSKASTARSSSSLSQNSSNQFSSAKLPLASTAPTPLHRNQKCLNHQSTGIR